MNWRYHVEAYQNLAWQRVEVAVTLETAKAWMDTLHAAGYRTRLIRILFP